MKLHSIFNRANVINTRGLTLIEILVVIGVLFTVMGLSYMTMDSYRGYAFRGSRDMLVAVLQKARSQGINNMCFGGGCTNGVPHGVHFESGQYVIFQGSDWAGHDSSFDEIIQVDAKNVLISGPDVVFAKLSGDASPAGSTITVSDDAGHSSVITINGEGQIVWTN